MAKIKLNLLNIFALKIKKNTLQYEAEDIDEVISMFFSDYRKELNGIFKNKKDMISRSLILINGKNLKVLKNRMKLNEGDEITLSLPVTGG